MSEISIIDRPTRVSDNLSVMAKDQNPPIYDALMAFKPEGMTANAWAVRAELNRNVFYDIRKNGDAARATLEKLLDVAGVSFGEFDQKRRELSAGTSYATPKIVERLADPYQAFRAFDRPKDVPVLGTPSCGEMVLVVDGEEQHIETLDVDLDEVIEFVRRPIALDGRKDVYAIYPNGFSMIPRFEPGELQYVESRKPASIGDYVVVQLRRPDDHSGERIVSALLKRLVRQNMDWIELEQFNPPAIFRIERRRIAKIDRVLKLEELVVF